MRRRQRGTIVNISLRGILSSGGGYYCSSKFALEGLTEALWQEIEPLGLRALLVEPGPHRTGMDTRVRFSGSVIDAYEGCLRQNRADHGGYQSGAIPRRSNQGYLCYLPRGAREQQTSSDDPGE